MKEKILIVDDEKEIRSLLSKALAKFGGYQIEVAEDGEQALKKMEGHRFDLVLTDLAMPRMDGLKLIDQIATAQPNTLIVLMTGHGSIDSAIEAMKRGASDYLTKPLNLNELVIRLHKVLEERTRFMSLKDYAAELERANQDLKRIDQMKSEFVSVASHELRTPLASIKNAVQLILKGKTGEINEAQTKFLSMAERNIDRLTNILNDLLNCSRIESGKIEIKLEDLELKGILESTTSSLKPQADAKSIRLETVLSKNLPLVYGDREKIEQILTNLIGNALKFTPEGGQILISAEPYQPSREEGTGQMVSVSIKDTGIGISEEHRQAIFEKFYQVEGSLHRSVGGTGLGLAITKGLVETMNGKIWVESELGKGSAFTFSLPVSKGERREPQFRYILDREFQHAQLNHTPLTLFFMEVSEQRAGMSEDLLIRLEEKAKKCFHRKSDRVLKTEREKLIVALCETDRKGAQVIQHRIKEEFDQYPLGDPEQPLGLKISFATYPDEALSKRELFRKAREGLRGSP
ncbi:MAG: hypothetical protein A2156_07275 [Deltaproteobacteria bacterium RBG_16_48_10]|nr:MAG: hypothetical protein A2156_07275 [Deltaproteobacteria bacterium RBG_16_48_10]